MYLILFLLKDIFWGADISNTKRKPDTFISHIYQYIILVKSLKVEFLGY